MLWALALGVDWALTYLTAARGGGWRINSVAHWVERHGLVIILALGESIVAIGVGASGSRLDWQLLAGAILGILIATALWWLYFDLTADAAERELLRLDPKRLVRVAIDSYSYAHFLLILGIVVTAVGIEEVLAHAHDRAGLGAFAAGCLFAGPATYLAGHVLAWVRLHGAVKGQRLVAALLLVALAPLAARIAPLAALSLAAAVLAALVLYETRRYAASRASLHEDEM